MATLLRNAELRCELLRQPAEADRIGCSALTLEGS
jgi:hypothetical protein